MNEELQKEVEAVFKIPQCLTDQVSANFVTDVVDLTFFHDEWTKLTTPEKQARVRRVLESMEEAGQLSSSMTKVKSRHFEDDIEAPSLPSRVRVFARAKRSLVGS